MSEIYGAEHLLRLFGMCRCGRLDLNNQLIDSSLVRLPELVAEAGIDEDGRQYIKEKSESILAYLTRSDSTPAALHNNHCTVWLVFSSPSGILKRIGKQCSSRSMRIPLRSIGVWRSEMQLVFHCAASPRMSPEKSSEDRAIFLIYSWGLDICDRLNSD